MSAASDTWADHIGLHPWIADEGREGVFYNRAYVAGRRRTDAPTSPPVSFHSATSATERQRDNA